MSPGITSNSVSVFRIHRRLHWLLLMGISVLALWGNFGFNLLSLARFAWFESFQRDSEALVVARLVQNRATGFGSFHSMMGYYTNAALADMILRFDTPYDLYAATEDKAPQIVLQLLKPYDYDLYRSQYGGQAVGLAAVEPMIQALKDLVARNRGASAASPAPPHQPPVLLLQLSVAFCNAVILTALIGWFAAEFGLGIGWCLLLLTLCSPWLSVFGRNLYWMMGTWFLPLVATAWVGRWFDRRGHRDGMDTAAFLVLLALGTGGGIFLKSTMGYEYLSSILLAQMSALIFYGVKWRWNSVRLIAALGLNAGAAFFGFALAVRLHLVQLTASFDGSTERAWQHMKYLITHRAVGDAATLMAHYGTTGSSFGNVFRYVFKVSRPFPPFILFALPTLWVAFKVLRRRGSPMNASLVSLAWVTLFSFLAPLSWYVLAKGHSFMHPHVNYVLWHLPTLFFAGALVAAYVRARTGLCLSISSSPSPFPVTGNERSLNPDLTATRPSA